MPGAVLGDRSILGTVGILDLRKLRNSLLHQVCVRYACWAVQYAVSTEINGECQGVQTFMEKTEWITGCAPERSRGHRGKAPYILAGQVWPGENGICKEL